MSRVKVSVTLAVVLALLAAGAGLAAWTGLESQAGPPASGAPFIPFSHVESLPAGAISEEWVYESETSAVLYWQTENRARSCVEYGLTPDCPLKIAEAEPSAVSGQPYWTHFHRLTGLQSDAEYHYRLACVGADGSRSVSPTLTLHTKRYAQAVRVPDDLSGPPYVLDRANTTYVVTRDLTFPLGGLLVKADGVSLDLDGHTLVYNDEPAQRSAEWDKRAYEGHDFGVRVEGRVQVVIVNGSIRQGRGNTPGTAVGIGCNPIYSQAARNVIAAVDCVWSGADVSGLFLHESSGDHVHHCVLDDRGEGVSDRHMAIRSVGGNAWGNYDHNLIKATRQQGLANAVRATHNEIYLRSCCTNSFAITPTPDAKLPIEVACNRIVGVGEHPVGIGMFGVFQPGSTVHHNYVEVKCTKTGQEYGYTGSACFRTTWGADHLDVGHNTFLAYADVFGDQTAKARTLWVGLPVFTPRGGNDKIVDARGYFHDNLIIARGPAGAPAGAICVVCLNDSPNLIFAHNRVISTWGNVVLADHYGHADGYPKFVGNQFEREGVASDYFPIRHEYGGMPATAGLLDNRFLPAGEAPRFKLQDKGRLAQFEMVTIRVCDQQGQPLGDALMTILDSALQPVFTGRTSQSDAPAMLVSRPGPAFAVVQPPQLDAKDFIEPLTIAAGCVNVPLAGCIYEPGKEQAVGPYNMRVEKAGFHSASQPIKLGGAIVEIRLTPLAVP